MITGSDEPGDVNDGSGDLLAETVDLLSVADYSLRLKAAHQSHGAPKQWTRPWSRSGRPRH